MPSLSVIVVNWNVRDLLRNCLSSVFEEINRSGLAIAGAPPKRGAGGEAEILVVDNASQDGSVEMVQREFPAVRLFANQRNLGFGAGNNQALAAAAGELVLFLNPDTLVKPGAISILAGFLEEQPGVGCVGPRLLNPDGTVQPSRRAFPRLSTAFVESTVLQRHFGQLGAVRRYYLADAADDRAQAVDWLVGACLMIPWRVLEEVGGFDERFFMYSEEMDLCYRIKEAGYQVWYLPQAEVIHHEAASSSQDLFRQNVNFHQSRYRFFRKHHGRIGALALRWFTFLTYLFLLSEEAGKLLLQPSKRTLRRERIRLYARVVAWYLSAS
ncbi:MAG: glycosyltransferase family 2 protein [Chloroflexota bacterium]|nr:glycosyltransferase family 2 protein [Chloroflexota bacterium]